MSRISWFDKFRIYNGVYQINLTGRARLPKYSELSNYSDTTKYLYNNLEYYEDVPGTNNIENIYGYWTMDLSTNTYNDKYAYGYIVGYWGTLANNVTLEFSFYGIRPVITLNKSDLG